MDPLTAALIKHPLPQLPLQRLDEADCPALAQLNSMERQNSLSEIVIDPLLYRNTTNTQEDYCAKIELIERLVSSIFPHSNKKQARVIAILAESLLARCGETECYYVRRKALVMQLPSNAKLIVDGCCKTLFLLPAKSDGDASGTYKRGRRLLACQIDTGLIGKLYTLTPINRRDAAKCKVFKKAQRNADVIRENLRSGYPHCLTRYLLPKGPEQAKPMDIVEAFTGDLNLPSYYLPSTKWRIQLMKKLASIISDFHSKNFAVRDLKHNNILYRGSIFRDGSDLEIAVSDFDFFLNQNDPVKGRSRYVLGTTAYLPPELLMRRMIDDGTINEKIHTEEIEMIRQYQPLFPPADLDQYDMRCADVYALGVVFYPFLHNKMVPWHTGYSTSWVFKQQIQLLPEEAGPEKPQITGFSYADLTAQTDYTYKRLKHMVHMMLHPLASKRWKINQVLDVLGDC